MLGGGGLATFQSTYHVVQNLIPDDSDHLKALLASDAVDDHVAVDANEVLAVQNRVFILLCFPISGVLTARLFSF